MSVEMPLEFVFVSENMKSIMKIIGQISPYDATVLLTGETGTGKELLARITHQKSSRRDKPFVAVNCGVLSGQLFEDKLFGHEAGSFTGAIKMVKGLLEIANKGTLFLDEVSEITLQSQVDLLRVLEDGEFRRIGGKETIKVDARIIAATNKNLATLVEKKQFRIDLYYRLHVIPVHIPPLRERKADIPKLLEYFIDLFSARYKKPKINFSQKALSILLSHDWPGNVRELRNLVERIFLTTNNELVTPEDFPLDFKKFVSEPLIPSLEDIRKKAEKEAIINALIQVRGDREKAAKLLKISPRTLRHKIREYNIAKMTFK